jgi:hypothetical protein
MSAKEVLTTIVLPVVIGLVPWLLEKRGLLCPRG